MKESEIIKRIAKNWDKQREERRLEVKQIVTKTIKPFYNGAVHVLPSSTFYYCINP